MLPGKLFSSISLLFISSPVALAIAAVDRGRAATAWPYAPFTTDGRWIRDAAGHNITYAGVNWPGAADTMTPEGLQYSSIASIVSKIKSLGMNVIRLTYAIQMIDEYYEAGEVDIPILDSFITALGEENGTSIFNDVIANNPQFTAKTTRLEVFDAVAAECFAQEIYVHLDNHVSKAEWCCSETDGNAWWGDTYFIVSNWKRGLEYMATRGSSWGNLMSMSLRNEPRDPLDNVTLADDYYNWADWYVNVVAGADTINAANSDVLIFFSGLDYDTDLTPIPTGSALGDGYFFDKNDFSYSDKLVLEIHNYDNDATSCADLESSLYESVYSAMDSSNKSVVNLMPVVMTEWGQLQTDATYETVYSTCLNSFLTGLHGGWMVWVLVGSYYIRQGIQDFDETWGLLNHNWTDWRCPDGIETDIIPMVSGTKTYD